MRSLRRRSSWVAPGNSPVLCPRAWSYARRAPLFVFEEDGRPSALRPPGGMCVCICCANPRPLPAARSGRHAHQALPPVATRRPSLGSLSDAPLLHDSTRCRTPMGVSAAALSATPAVCHPQTISTACSLVAGTCFTRGRRAQRDSTSGRHAARSYERRGGADVPPGAPVALPRSCRVAYVRATVRSS